VKVVLFCGGLGMRLREYSENVPKPMVPIGYRPILWHLMKYYAHYGHKDFILCLGYRGDAVRHYFLNYEECMTNDFVMTNGGRTRELVNSDIEDWRITFVDTGNMSNIGERLVAVRNYVADEEVFLANYADGLTDLPLPEQLEHFHRHDRIASFLSVKPNLSYHFVATDDDGRVQAFRDIVQSGLRVNGGFFAFKREIFDYMRPGEELVLEPFQRLVDAGQLLAYPYDGFWMAMDTAKDKRRIDDLFESGMPPWMVWDRASGSVSGSPGRPSVDGPSDARAARAAA
jgi:glucose-1-phosphate cytidylyltransferase